MGDRDRQPRQGADAKSASQETDTQDGPTPQQAMLQRKIQRRAAARNAPDAVVQRKTQEGAGGQQAEAPSAAQASSATIHALQDHMKLTAMRMYGVAHNITTLLAAPRDGDAGIFPLLDQLEGQVEAIFSALDHLHGEIAHTGDLMRGAMSEEVSLLRGAWYDNNGLARALGSIYWLTHDAQLNEKPEAKGRRLSMTPIQEKLKAIYAALHIDENDIQNTYQARGTDLDESLHKAAADAFDSGLNALHLVAQRVRADLDALDDKGALEMATELQAVAQEAADSTRALDAKKAPAALRVVAELEALQADLAKRSGPKVAPLVRLIGKGGALQPQLDAIKAAAAKAQGKKH